MADTNPFQLQNDPPKHRQPAFESNTGRQSLLLPDMDDLPGQGLMFQIGGAPPPKGFGLSCDGWCDRKNTSTHMDEKGYIYCEPCGNKRRQSGYTVRRLTRDEIALLRIGMPVKEF